jgi:hypothetical protein
VGKVWEKAGKLWGEVWEWEREKEWEKAGKMWEKVQEKVWE